MTKRLLRKIFVPLLACLLGATVAHAQKTQAQISAEITTLFPDNTVGAITPAGLRTVTNDIVTSIMPTAPVIGGNLACFSGTTGLLQDCGLAPPASGIVGISEAQTLTNKTINGATNTLTVRLASDVTGNLPVTNLASGTGATSSSFWRGDGVWATPGGGGDFVGPASSVSANVVSFNGTTGKLGQDSGIPAAALPTSVGQLPGVSTNTAVTTGNVGQVLQASGSSALTTNTPLSIANIAVTAGDWDVSALAQCSGVGSTSATDCEASISTTNNTLDTTVGQYGHFRTPAGLDFQFAVSIPMVPVLLSGTTTHYCVMRATFTASTYSGSCKILARRRR